MDEPPGRLEGVLGRQSLPAFGGGGVDVGGHGLQGASVLRSGPDSAALAAHHRRYARQEVAEVVGQVGVVAGQHALPGEVAVLAEGGVPEEVVAIRVDAEIGDQLRGSDLVELGLRHLLAADKEPAVGEHTAGQLQACRHQHRRPPHAMEPRDLLADQVVVNRPPVPEPFVVLAVADGRDVVHQGFEPDVRDVLRVPRDRNDPAQ